MTAVDRPEKIPLSDRIAAEFIKRLAEGTTPWQCPYERSQLGGLPMNPTTGKRYRGINALWLNLMSPTDDPRWLTYRQAEERGWQVRRGSKSQTVEFWQIEKEERDKQTGEKRLVRLERPKAFYAAVFHATQVDGLPDLVVPKHEWEPVARVESLLKGSGAVVRHRGGATPHYSPAKDHIVMPARAQFPDAARYAATALHELGHWTGAPDRLNRDLSHRFGTEGYAREELRAEIASYLLGQELGIGHDPGNHHAYVASWIQALKDDPREIFRACADAEKIVTFVRQFDRYQELGREQAQAQSAAAPTQEHPQDLPFDLQTLARPPGAGLAPRPVPIPARAHKKVLEMAR